VRAVPEKPAKVLLDEAADADLLVVGHRGIGGVASACDARRDRRLALRVGHRSGKESR
jgi:nucleotide-binding universal stress UspA family protein